MTAEQDKIEALEIRCAVLEALLLHYAPAAAVITLSAPEAVAKRGRLLEMRERELKAAA
jgi:hypothetical protein